MFRRVVSEAPQLLGRPALLATSSAALPDSAASAVVTPMRFFTKQKNPYTTLGIKNGATKQEIKKAYRVLAAKHHPDAPGGNSEKFQEIQSAYEEVKSGVWIPKDDGSGGGGGGDGASRQNNKYGGFQWYTDGKRRNKVSYESMQQKMQGEGKEGPSFDDDDEEEPKSKFKNPMGASDQQVEAWFRFIASWAMTFITLRILLFLAFPPKHQHKEKKPLPDRPRKLPPPKPLPNQ